MLRLQLFELSQRCCSCSQTIRRSITFGTRLTSSSIPVSPCLVNHIQQRYIGHATRHTQEPSTPDQGAEPLPSMDKITSTANNYVKHCVKLRTSAKYRSESGRFLLSGPELLKEAAGQTCSCWCTSLHEWHAWGSVNRKRLHIAAMTECCIVYACFDCSL